MASLLQDFLQVFHLDFTLAVFQPEINSVSVLVSSAVHDGAPAEGDVLLFHPLKPVYSQSGLKTVCRLLPVTLDFICHLPCFLFPSLLPVAPSVPVMSQLNGLEGRDAVCRELSLSQSELNRNCPLLLELVRRGRHRHSQVRPSTNQLAALPSLLVC